MSPVACDLGKLAISSIVVNEVIKTKRVTHGSRSKISLVKEVVASFSNFFCLAQVSKIVVHFN